MAKAVSLRMVNFMIVMVSVLRFVFYDDVYAAPTTLLIDFDACFSWYVGIGHGSLIGVSNEHGR